MATWHQQKGGLIGLYDKPKRGHKVVVNQPGQFAYAIEFNVKRKAEKLARKFGGIIISAGRS